MTDIKQESIPPISTDSAAKRGESISEEAAQVGFDWACAQDVIPKLREEADEIERALLAGDRENLVEEVGDLFFALVNFCRKAKIDSEAAFQSGVDKFERRYRRLEALIASSGRDIRALTAGELEDVWSLVKKEEHHA